MDKVYTLIYLVKDSHGNKDSATFECNSEIIQICGMKDKDGNPLYFESDAYHLSTWCNDNNLSIRKVKREDNFDTLWDQNA